MVSSPQPLEPFRANNTYSQAGEDGMLTEIFRRLNIEKGTFCEFGAWDGQHLSNTYAFYERGWGGWYIEGNEERYQDLLRNVDRNDVDKICAWVSRTGANTLDQILQNSRLYKEGVTTLDLLSIDIDSDDLAIWKSVKAFRPKVVIIEVNPTIPIDVYFENPEGEFKGNSTLSTYEYARSIDYGLIATSACNMIFVDTRIEGHGFSLLEIAQPPLISGKRYFFGYDGSLIIKDANSKDPHVVPEVIRVPWNGAQFAQPVSPYFRDTSDNKAYRRTGHWLARIRLAIVHPILALTAKAYKS